MATIVSVEEARERLDDLIEEALAGGDVIIVTPEGVAVRIVPADGADIAGTGANR